MSQTPYFPFYAGDYLSDTLLLTLEEHGAYMKLLLVSWNNGEPLLDDDLLLARYLNITPKRWMKLRTILERFFVSENGRFFSKRLEKEREKIAEKIEKNRVSGAMGGRPKSLKTNKPQKGNGSVSLSDKKPIPEPEPELEPDSKKPPNPLSGGIDIPQRFVDIWHEVLAGTVVPKVRDLSVARKAAIKKRFADTFDNDLEQWRRCCQTILESDFLSGRESSWKVGFDWILKPANLTKVLEDTYANKKGPNNDQRSNGLNSALGVLQDMHSGESPGNGRDNEASHPGTDDRGASGFVGPISRSH